MRSQSPAYDYNSINRVHVESVRTSSFWADPRLRVLEASPISISNLASEAMKVRGTDPSTVLQEIARVPVCCGAQTGEARQAF